jgi:hypothetical protein
MDLEQRVFELFQDLDGFRLDDYKAMGDPEEGMGALVRFVAESANAEDETFTRRGDNLYAWIDRESHVETLLTTQRELSLQKENVQLIGLDHPLVATFLKKYWPRDRTCSSARAPSDQESLSSAMAAAERPRAPLPSSAARASSKAPTEMPLDMPSLTFVRNSVYSSLMFVAMRDWTCFGISEKNLGRRCDG